MKPVEEFLQRLLEDENALVPSTGNQVVKGTLKDELYSILEIMLEDENFLKIIEWYSKNDVDSFPFLVSNKEDFIKKFRMFRNAILNAVRQEAKVDLPFLDSGEKY